MLVVVDASGMVHKTRGLGFRVSIVLVVVDASGMVHKTRGLGFRV